MSDIMNKEGIMNSSETPIAREELHFRQIDIRGFRRSDGLFEVEGRVVDRRSRDQSIFGRTIPAGTPLHDMGVRLVFDVNLVVHGVETFTDAAPYEACPAGGIVLQKLIGVRMTSGWTKEVRSRIARAESCTHLIELLVPLATVAFQSVSAVGQLRTDTLDATGRPSKINSCYAYAADGELVRRRWPDYHQPQKE
jgi:hypothetical protein